MRPTLLHFRSPKEHTPDYYDLKLSNHGEYYNFRLKSINRKNSNLPQSERFAQYRVFMGGSTVSSFLGPGAYNDHETYLKLTKAPCSSVMKRACALPHEESGKCCYIMVGSNLAYEPCFLKNTSSNNLRDATSGDPLKTSDCRVSPFAAMSKRSLSQIRDRVSSMAAASGGSITGGYGTTGGFGKTTISDNEGQMARLQRSFKDQQSASLIMNDSEDQEKSPGDFPKEFSRPNTCQHCQRRIPFASTPGSLPNQKKYGYSLTLSAKASQNNSASKTTAGQDQFGYSQISNAEHSTTIEPTSTNNLKGIKEEPSSSQKISMSPGHRQFDERPLSLPGSQQKRAGHARLASLAPKTATNFHKMMKGLYSNPLKVLQQQDVKDQALAKSFNILYAYGEMLPMVNQALAAGRKGRSGSKRKPSSGKKVFEEDRSGHRYMTVIRDSPNTVQKREELEKKKNEIMNMKFEQPKKMIDMSQINQYISGRYNTGKGLSEHFKDQQQ